jgi:hypothetical protein
MYRLPHGKIHGQQRYVPGYCVYSPPQPCVLSTSLINSMRRVNAAGNKNCILCTDNATTLIVASTSEDACVCSAGFMDTSQETICFSGNPCAPNNFCSFEFGTFGVCMMCPGTCCSGPSTYFGNASNSAYLSSQEGVQACYAACGGTQPGPPSSNCGSATGKRRKHEQMTEALAPLPSVSGSGFRSGNRRDGTGGKKRTCAPCALGSYKSYAG